MILKNIVSVLTLCGVVSVGWAGDEQNAADDSAFLRMKSEKGLIALEVAVQTLTSCQPDAPEVLLVGVAHIAEASFYEGIDKVLSSADVVLYESVLPAGADRPSGDTEEQRIETTQASMAFVGSLLAWSEQVEGTSPKTLAELGVSIKKLDARMERWLQEASVDAWGQPLIYVPATQNSPWVLISLGSDGASGGDDSAADLQLENSSDIQAPATSSDHGLQGRLADALGLAFQLDSLPYDNLSWRCSDLTFDRLARRAKERGFELDSLADTLAGSSLPAKFVKTILAAIPILDAMAGGRVTDALKVMMIEVLSDETMIEASMSYLGEGFAEVIINDRNKAVMDDLAEIIRGEPEVKSVAILYGAGHMQDFLVRLEERFCYQPTDKQWLVAMEVDLNKSALSRLELAQIRVAMKRMLDMAKSQMESQE